MRSNVYLRKRQTKKGETRYILLIREHGRQEVWKNLGPVSKKKAETIRIQILSQLLNGTYQKEPEISLYLNEFVKRFFANFAEGSRAPKTVQLYRERLKLFQGHFPGCRLQQITQQDIEGYLSGRRVSNRTRNIDLSVLRLFFAKAVEWKYLAQSPARRIKAFPEASQGSQALTAKELDALWNRLTAWQKSIIRVMVNSGLRPGELSQLKFKDIDWEENRLWVANDKDRITKNRKSRFIPLNEDLREELLFLKEHLPKRGGHHNQEYRKRKPHQGEYIFCHDDGRPIKCFRHAITRALKANGIHGVTPHGLRKTFCSQLARHKVHPKVAQQLLGHSDIRLTMKVYTQIDDDQLQEAVNALPSTRNRKLEKTAENFVGI